MKTRRSVRPEPPNRTVGEIQVDFDKAMTELTDGLQALEDLISDMGIRGTFRASLANPSGSNQ